MRSFEVLQSKTSSELEMTGIKNTGREKLVERNIEEALESHLWNTSYAK